MSITVAIATYNRSYSLKRCLLALTKQTDNKFDVVIVDGGSSDKTIQIINSFKKKLTIKLIIDPKPHLAYIRDLAWRNSKTDIVATIDDDVIVDPSWVEAIRYAFDINKNLGGVSGPTTIPAKLLKKRDVFALHTTKNRFLKQIAVLYFNLFMNGERDAIGKIYPSGAWSPGSNFPKSRRLKQSIQVDYLEACNYAVPKRILKKINGYDIGYKKTSEWCEIDLAFRIRKLGYKLLFDPNISVEHHVSKSGVFVRRKFPLHRIKNFVRFYHRSYYPKSILGYFRFLMYLGFIVSYYIYLWLSFSR